MSVSGHVKYMSSACEVGLHVCACAPCCQGGNAAYHVPEDLADLYYYFLLLLTTTTAYHVPEDLADLGVGERGRLDILRGDEGADGEG